jgi:hypothetical protein
MPTRKALIVIAAALAAQAHAAPADPLRTPECATARAALEASLDEPLQSRRDHPERLARARKQVLDSCLGRMNANPERSGAPDPPVAVPPPIIEVPRTAQARRPAPVARPELVIPRAATITACDPAGCWDSSGRRLNNMGPVLVGPHGVCIPQAGQVNCPSP